MESIRYSINTRETKFTLPVSDESDEEDIGDRFVLED